MSTPIPEDAVVVDRAGGKETIIRFFYPNRATGADARVVSLSGGRVTWEWTLPDGTKRRASRTVGSNREVLSTVEGATLNQVCDYPVDSEMGRDKEGVRAPRGAFRSKVAPAGGTVER